MTTARTLADRAARDMRKRELALERGKRRQELRHRQKKRSHRCRWSEFYENGVLTHMVCIDCARKLRIVQL